DTGTTDATGVTFDNTPDANTTLVGGSIAVSPVALNDTFPVTVLGNVSIDSAALAVPFSVTANDYMGINSTSTIASFSATSAQGGQVAMTTSGAGIGQFTYNPPPGYEGTDTFTYTLSDNTNAPSAAANRTATVTINVSGMIWFINNNAASCLTLAAGCGRLTNPFSTLAAFTSLNNGTANNPAPNDNIFIYESATAYTGGITLLSGQKLIGQDSTQTLSAITGLTPPTGSAALPAMNTGGNATTIQNAAGNGVALNSGNTLNGFTAGIATSNAITGTNFGTLTVADVIVSTTGQALNLTNGTLSATFSSVTSSGGTNNLLLATGGTTLAGTLTINAGALSGATSDAFVVSGTGTSTTNITYNGTINNTTAHPVNIANKTGGTVAFGGTVSGTSNGILLNSNTNATIAFSGGLNLSTGANIAFSATGGGTVNATQNNTSIVNMLTTTTGIALNVSSTTIGASGLTFRSISSNGAASGIVLITTGTSGGLTVTGNGGSCTLATPTCTGGIIQNSTGPGISLSSTKNVSLTRMKIQSSGGDGVGGPNTSAFDAQRGTRGDTVNGLTFDNGIIADTNTSGSVSGTVADNGIDLENASGSIIVSNSVIDQAPHNGIYIDQNSTSLTAFNVTNTTISNQPNTST
ncbi:MAG: hypothetical protein LC737_01165, partial [Chloroflexi bacterium]|nr:hypothetical protein [Chloroflexota bacterium]